MVPAGRGRKLTVTPVELPAADGRGIEMGREPKGMRVKAVGMPFAFPVPEKDIETGSHCWMVEKLNLNWSARATWPNANRERKRTNMEGIK